MEMALLRTYAPQLPLWIRHSARGARGGLLVPHGDCHPRQDNLQQGQGVPLRRRFLASAAANSASSFVSGYPAVAAARGAGSSSAAAKKNLLLLHHPAPAQQGRLFCSHIDYFRKDGKRRGPEHGSTIPTFGVARNKLQEAMAENHPEQMLESLSALKVFAGDKYYYGNDYRAKELLLAAVSPFALLGSKHGGGGGGGGLDLDDDVVKESLAVACLLLQNASVLVRTELWSEISLDKGLRTSLERISGSGCDEVRKLANEILEQLPSTPN